MNLIRKACIVFAIIFMVMPELGFAQYQHTVAPFWSNLGNPHRYELGGGIVNPSGTFTGVVRVYGPNNYYKGDTFAQRKLPGTGYGGSFGLCLPFKATGHISCWAVATQLMFNMYTWADLNQTYGTDGNYKASKTPLSAGTMQVALPIGIDYKVGNDAILTKRLPFGIALGAGLIPQMTMTKLNEVTTYKTQYGYGCLPYAKFDLNMFTGLCWKLRVMYSVGNVNLLDVNKKMGDFNDGAFTMRSGSQLMFSFILMPFSGGWKEYAWYNTYDSYNQYDKFN